MNLRQGHRKALLRSQASDLLMHERIQTTLARAKVVRRLAERMITLAKRETLHARRLAYRQLKADRVVRKLFDTLAYRYAERKGGYTRIIKLGQRKGDAAEVVYLELVDRVVVEKEKKEDKAAKATKAPSKPGAKVPAGAKPVEKKTEKKEDKPAPSKAEGKTEEKKRRLFGLPFKRKGPKAGEGPSKGKTGPKKV